MGPIVKNCTDDVTHFFNSTGRAFFFYSKQSGVLLAGLWLGNFFFFFKCKILSVAFFTQDSHWGSSRVYNKREACRTPNVTNGKCIRKVT